MADIKLYVVVRWLTSGMLDHVPTSLLDHCPKLLRLSRAGGEHAGREVLDGDGGALRDGRAAGNRLAGVELGRFAAKADIHAGEPNGRWGASLPTLAPLQIK